MKTASTPATRERGGGLPGLELNVLIGDGGRDRARAGAVTPAMTDAQANEARQAPRSRRSRTSAARATELRCDVVTLYQGGEYQLYRYKKYTDVRLVFAPEQQIAFFGGDPDNFTFPRYDLDICLFRVYENGQPVKPASLPALDRQGPAEGDLVFVSGHPGSTSRMETIGRSSSTSRDKALPFRLESAEAAARRPARVRGRRRGAEAARARPRSSAYENSQKAIGGYYAALLDPKGMARKADEETRLRAKVAADAALAQATGDPWATVAAIQQKLGAPGAGGAAHGLRRIAAARHRRRDRPVRDAR